MPTEEFVMRGQRASTAGLNTEVLNFGAKHGYAFRLIDFQIYPSTNISGQSVELTAAITAGKTAVDSESPDFSNEGLIATALYKASEDIRYGAGFVHTVINDTFLITQNIILSVGDLGGSATPVNWQCRFKPVKMNEAEMANANLRQFHVFDE